MKTMTKTNYAKCQCLLFAAVVCRAPLHCVCWHGCLRILSWIATQVAPARILSVSHSLSNLWTIHSYGIVCCSTHLNIHRCVGCTMNRATAMAIRKKYIHTKISLIMSFIHFAKGMFCWRFAVISAMCLLFGAFTF